MEAGARDHDIRNGNTFCVAEHHAPSVALRASSFEYLPDEAALD